MLIRQLTPDDTTLHTALGELTVEVYRALHPEIDHDGYAEELADVPGRVRDAVVLVAIDDGGDELLGGVTYVSDRSSPLAEWSEDSTAGIRMLAVGPAARRQGVGEALVRGCIERAEADGRSAVVLLSSSLMVDAHRLYDRLGFVRDERMDEQIEGWQLLGFRYALDGRGRPERERVAVRG